MAILTDVTKRTATTATIAKSAAPTLTDKNKSAAPVLTDKTKS